MSVRIREQCSDPVSAHSLGQVTRSCPGLVDDVRIGASLEERFHCRFLPTRVEHRTPQGCVPEPVSRVHWRSRLQKDPDRLGLRLLRSEVQSREALPVGQVDLVPGGQAVSDAWDVAFKGPVVKFLTTLAIHADSLSHSHDRSSARSRITVRGR